MPLVEIILRLLAVLAPFVLEIIRERESQDEKERQTRDPKAPDDE